MNTDFRLSTGLFTHPKFVKLRRKIGAEGALSYLALLSFVAQNNPDGDLRAMDAEEIAIAGQYDGDADEFVAALVAVRLLDAPDGHGDSYKVHDWGVLARTVPPPADHILFGTMRYEARTEYANEIFERDEYTCTYCGATENLTLDHIKALSRGGDNSRENLTTACRSCNSSKGAKTLEEWITQ